MKEKASQKEKPFLLNNGSSFLKGFPAHVKKNLINNAFSNLASFKTGWTSLL